MDHSPEDNDPMEAVYAEVTSSQMQFTDPDDPLAVSASVSALRSRLVVSDSSDEDKDILEDGGGAEMEGGRPHAGEPATNAPPQSTNTPLLGLGMP